MRGEERIVGALRAEPAISADRLGGGSTRTGDAPHRLHRYEQRIRSENRAIEPDIAAIAPDRNPALANVAGQGIGDRRTIVCQDRLLVERAAPATSLRLRRLRPALESIGETRFGEVEWFLRAAERQGQPKRKDRPDENGERADESGLLATRHPVRP